MATAIKFRPVVTFPKDFVTQQTCSEIYETESMTSM